MSDLVTVRCWLWHEPGLSAVEIQKALRVPRDTARQLRRDAGMPDVATRVRWEWERNRDVTGAELARRFGVDPKTTRNVLRDLRGPAYGVKPRIEDVDGFWEQVRLTQLERIRV